MLIIYFALMPVAGVLSNCREIHAPSPIICGINEEYSPCRMKCPPQFCNISYTDFVCPVDEPCEPGYNCIKDYLRGPNGTCIFNEECPPPPSPIICGINEEYSPCRMKCPPQFCNISYTDFVCPVDEPCEPGCNCIKDYLRGPNGTCIFNEECPPAPSPIICGINEEYSPCRMKCPPQFCNISYTDFVCPVDEPCEPGCNCIKDYLRGPNGTCIFNEECPPPPSPIICGINEEYSPCRMKYPPQFCNISYTDFVCPVDEPCEPGSPQIPICGENEVGSTCRKTCPPDTCDFDPTKEACKPGPCQPGCNCIKDYCRDATGKCVPKEQCPKSNKCVPSMICEIPYKCRRTCAEPNPPNCPAYSNVSEKVKGCQCKPGFILLGKGPPCKCVRIEDCTQQKGCNGDNKAHITKYPPPCPSTCQSPNQVPCKKVCLDVGCSCNDGMILSKLNGKCINPDDCPAPVNCTRPNEIWSNCPSACLREGCENANEEPSVCNTLVLNCQPRCICKPNTFRDKNNICVPVEQCPPQIPICGENEVGSNCRKTCPPDTCNFDPTKEACKPGPCQPGCNCIKDYCRDATGKCVPKEQCPKSNKCVPSMICEIPYKCRRTCAEPNPPNCPAYSNVSENVKGCKCKPGFILLEKGPPFKCVRIEDCPQQKGCNGDNNAHITKCPPPCPSTCQSPNQVTCKKACLDVGCSCNDGMILSKLNGKCINPDDCPAPVNCTLPNEIWSNCPLACLREGCENAYEEPSVCNTLVLNCQPRCICKPNTFRDKNNICVPVEQCPPQIPICGENEVGSNCRKTCPPDTCNFDPTKEACKPSPCQPGCNCIKDYCRDATGKCVPKEQCPKSNKCVPSMICEIPYKCRRTCAEPNPPNCPAYSNVSENVKGCKCKPGFILLEKGPPFTCVRIEDCPQQKGCNGDNNAHITKCPPACPSTCQSPNKVTCKKACLDVGCSCNDGMILSKLNGKCINPDDCPGGNPCGMNATFRTCDNRCSNNYCPVDDSPPDFSCEPPSPCPSGCVCKFNYRKKSINDEKCILASECPPVNCTLPNEIWSNCPSACLREGCENAYEEPSVCNTLVLNCQPRCICKPNTFRDKNNICVPVEQCPKEKPQPYQ
ncbi:unnamed protein product [Parnassius apollo]|uniref:(apollo) hypothetical protein n=1 Tax=Parnassius apollo TaxID=110799 RepID=A0A8S3Y1M2_PARAO|nr:unnamed protein product [Parnassius apollo]